MDRKCKSSQACVHIRRVHQCDGRSRSIGQRHPGRGRPIRGVRSGQSPAARRSQEIVGSSSFAPADHRRAVVLETESECGLATPRPIVLLGEYDSAVIKPESVRRRGARWSSSD
jgi:hypothetical protein